MEEITGPLGGPQTSTTVQRSSSNQSGTPSQRGNSVAVAIPARVTASASQRSSIHALALGTTGVAIRPGAGANVAVPQLMGGPAGDWYEVGSIRSGHYSGPHSSIGNPSISTRRRMMLPPPGPPPKSNWSKFKDAFRSFVAWVFSNVGICVLVVGYLMIGAFTFKQIEEPEELKISYQMGEYRSETVKKLWLITEELNTLHPKEWTERVTEVVKIFQDRVVEEEDKGYDGSDGPPRQWTFSGSLLYSITVITTIGK